MENQNTMLKLPPNSFEAERAVLGSMLIDREAIAEALEVISQSDFYRPDHQIAFLCMEELFTAGVPVDVVTLNDKLVEKGVYEQVGGVSFLTDIATAVSTGVNIKHYAKIVEEKSLLRKLIKAAGEISAVSYEAKEEVGFIIEKAEKLIFDIVQNRHSEQFTHIRDILVDSFEKIEEVYNTKTKITGVATGFIDFDEKTAGLQSSDLILIAARPSMGKSAFAMNIAQYAATRNNVSTAIFSLEMSKTQLVNRMLCTQALVDSGKLRTGALTNEDWISITRAMGPLAEAPIYFDDTPGISASEIRAKCRRLKIEKGIGLIIVDYLQLMSGSGKPESRQQEISDISRSLKAIAREMNAPVVALSQLSRAPETRADHRPMLSDLRDSGAIEQDADVVSFIYRDEYYNQDTDKKNVAEIIIAKQRNGPTGVVELAWLSQYAKFSNLQKNF